MEDTCLLKFLFCTVSNMKWLQNISIIYTGTDTAEKFFQCQCEQRAYVKRMFPWQTYKVVK